MGISTMGALSRKLQGSPGKRRMLKCFDNIMEAYGLEMNRAPVPHEGQTLTGPLFNEPMRVETVRRTNDGIWVLGLVGTRSERFRKVILNAIDLHSLTIQESLIFLRPKGDLCYGV